MQLMKCRMLSPNQSYWQSINRFISYAVYRAVLYIGFVGETRSDCQDMQKIGLHLFPLYLYEAV